MSVSAALPSGDATLTVIGTPLLEAVVIAAGALACGIFVRLLVEARTPSITVRVRSCPTLPRAA